MRLLLSLLFLTLSSLIFAQQNQDIREIMNQCLSITEIQPYFQKPDCAENRKPIVIQASDLFPADMQIIMFGEPVQFMTAEELTEDNILAYLTFEALEISGKHALAIFRYTIEGITVTANLEKHQGKWVMKEYTVTKA